MLWSKRLVILTEMIAFVAEISFELFKLLSSITYLLTGNTVYNNLTPV